MASEVGIENILRNRAGDELTAHERHVLEGAVTDMRTYPAGYTAVRQGEKVDISTLLVAGLMSRHIDARDGRRHMVGVYVPGDFVDLHAYALKRLDHDVGTLTDARVAIVPHQALERIQVSMPHLTRRLWFLTLLDGALHRQWVYRLSSLDARERVAHFLCETNARLLAIGLSDGRSFSLPVTQTDIGEVCSITNVHVNRVLRQLRESGLCTFRSSVVQIHDLKGLAAAGQFQPDYLYLNAPTTARAMGETP
jgi:CRP-like cAMP-binding protein